jgi:hypothetical protein
MRSVLVRTLVAVAAILGLYPVSLVAQEVRGTIALAPGEAGVAGVIVEAVDQASGARVVGTLTDARGLFVLRLPGPATITLRGLRIGQRPSIFGTYVLAAGEVRSVELVLTGEAISLARVSVVGRTECDVGNDPAQLVATLLDEARKVLRSTQLTSTSGQLTAEWTLSSQITTLRGNVITPETQQSFTSTTDRPFVSLSPDSLARFGYLIVSENDEYQYYAPDAEVLLSEEFVEGHCFAPEPWTTDGRDWIGLRFRPVRTARGVVGIQGTLWFDRPTAELRLLDYRYANLPRVVSGTAAGGSVEFLRIPAGSWLVHRWQIRMPRPRTNFEEVTNFGVVRGRRPVVRVQSMEIAGGEVREIRSRMGVLYSRDGGGIVAEAVRDAASVRALCETPPAIGQGVIWGRIVDASNAPRGGVTLELQWRQQFRWFAESQRAWETRSIRVRSEDDGSFFACGLALGVPVSIATLDGADSTGKVLTSIAEDTGGTSVTIKLTASDALGGIAGTLVGSAVDSLRASGPWTNAQIHIRGSRAHTQTDVDGRFSLDSIPPGDHELVAWDDELLLLGVPLPTVRVRVGPDGRVAPVTIATPSAETYFAARCGRGPLDGEGVLVGEVRDVSGARRSGLLVRADWATMLVSPEMSERRDLNATDTTDALGQYVLCGLPTEESLVKIGEAAVHFGGDVALSAAGVGVESGRVTMRLAGAGLRRRDLIVGTERNRASIGGLVLDPIGRPIPEATVVVGGLGGRSARTDSSGLWNLDGVPVHSTQITVRALRYSPLTFDMDPVSGRLLVGEIRLEPLPQLLAARVTRGRMEMADIRKAEFEDRRRSYGFGTFLDDSALARQPVVTQPFVMSYISKARYFTGGRLRGGGQMYNVLMGRSKIAFEIDRGGVDSAMSLCLPKWFIDGMNFGVPEAEEEEMWLRQAKRIEVYKATLAPPDFRDNDGCGVVVIWTR